MIDTVEELSKKKSVYILYDSIANLDNILWAIYTISKYERRGVGKFWTQMKTSSNHKYFKKTLNVVGTAINFSNANPYKVFDDKADMIKYYCKSLKKNPDKNKKLTTKMMILYPQYFI